ncbi:Protein PSK SIMULATOR [Heracleum sosnowskyi]|uniref:Protein PSK SIMULATOR n=1 Tax=Heracleum sosnowskyi TaxID=360622 RepID=A0AAD8M638_9APIA|nr:Protein PSK SIMULATOR [Heracleum sosnowskyi]
MALETWLLKVKKSISNTLHSTKPNTKNMVKKSSKVGVLALEITTLMSKLIHLWQSLSDKNITHLKTESVLLEGVHKIVSSDEFYLLSLACAEMVENLNFLAKSLSQLSKRCEDLNLQSFDRLFYEFSKTGRDPCNWIMSCKDMEAKIKKMDKYVKTTATVFRELEELSVVETVVKKSLKSYKEHQASIKQLKIIDQQQKLAWQRQEVKYKKEKSLWNRSFDTVAILLARSVFTILARIKLVFGTGHAYTIPITSLPRSLSASAAVYPSENHFDNSVSMVSGPLIMIKNSKQQEELQATSQGLFEMNSKILEPPTGTLGAAALALHYSNLIIVMEKMIKSPQLVGFDARDDLYAMLPQSIRWSLRGRLKGVGFTTTDPGLAGEWRDALGKILGWLSPLAHNMLKWQSERSLEQQTMTTKTNVLLLQTLYFANQEKTEDAITELLVGLNYIWRFEREMNAKALVQCNINGFLTLHNGAS